MCISVMSWPNPTGAGSPAGPGCPPPTGNPRSGSGRTASRTARQLRQVTGPGLDESFFEDLERDQRERATMSMLLPPQMLNTMVPNGAPGPARLHRGVLRRPGAPVHDPGVQRPADRLALPPVRPARLAARGRDVGGRGPDPPLPDQGAGRAAADLPAVLRPLHPDGPGRQPDGPDRQAQVRAGQGRPAGSHAVLPAPHARRAGRGGLRRRRGQPALAAAGGLRVRAARDRLDQGHPAGQQGADGAAAALAVRRGARGHGPAGRHGPRRAG